ncbi:hypothetical protein D3C73_1393390 [compost metagenome]
MDLLFLGQLAVRLGQSDNSENFVDGILMLFAVLTDVQSRHMEPEQLHLPDQLLDKAV